jgi:hypothetical protein
MLIQACDAIEGFLEGFKMNRSLSCFRQEAELVRRGGEQSFQVDLVEIINRVMLDKIAREK